MRQPGRISLRGKNLIAALLFLSAVGCFAAFVYYGAGDFPDETRTMRRDLALTGSIGFLVLTGIVGHQIRCPYCGCSLGALWEYCPECGREIDWTTSRNTSWRRRGKGRRSGRQPSGQKNAVEWVLTSPRCPCCGWSLWTKRRLSGGGEMRNYCPKCGWKIV